MLGGAGKVGLSTATRLAAHPSVSVVTIAGRDLERAKRAASEIGEKADFVKVDVTDEAELGRLASGYDILVNAAGPDYLVQPYAVRAAIEAGAHYCDVAADGPAAEYALGLGPKAQRNGITAVIGIGSCPGVSNLMMMHAAEQMDEIDTLEFHCIMPIAEFLGSGLHSTSADSQGTNCLDASWQTLVRWFTGPGRVFRDGKRTSVDISSSGVRIPLPGGGTVLAYPVDTLEPLTIPRHLDKVKNVSTMAGFLPPAFGDLIRRVTGQVAKGAIDVQRAVISLAGAVKSEPERWLANPEGLPMDFVLRARAVGVKDGTRTEYNIAQNPEWVSTASPLYLAATRILTGEITERGVLTPEDCLEPMPFMKEVASIMPGWPSGAKLFEESFEELD